MSKWKLVDANTGAELKFGDLRRTSRGDRVTLTGFEPPHKVAASTFSGFQSPCKAESTGRVWVNLVSDGTPAQVFPSAIAARYEDEHAT